MGTRNILGVSALAAVFFLPAASFSQSRFYEGKTITVITATSPGGTGDMRTKALVSGLRRHIPGNPTLLIEYMGGGAGRKAANYMYRTAHPDGLTIGVVGSGFVPHAVLGETGVLYDIDKFIYLGNNYTGNHYVFHTRKDAGLNNLDKLRAASGVRVGGQEIGHVIYVSGRLFAYVIGLKEPKFVIGYSGPELDLAAMRGEVDARASVPDAVIQRNRDWIDKALMDFHAISPIRKGQKHPHPQFAKLPDLEDFARSGRERRLLALDRAFRLIAQSVLLPPGTPNDRVQILRSAMRATYSDPEYYKEFKKLLGWEADPMMPEELDKVIRDLPREPEILDLFKKLVGPGPLPPR
jgi:tripartite-type tricarboxylate transporter receptor subunit TctC